MNRENILVVNIGKKTEAIPGKPTFAAPLDIAPKVGIYELIPIGSGEYKAVIKTREAWTRLTPSTASELGLGIEYKSLKRLIIAGFVKGQKITPSTWQFSICSYFEHLERVRNDPEFWDENHPQKNLQHYRECFAL